MYNANAMEDLIGNETLKIMKTVDWYNNWLYSFIKGHTKGKILEVGAGIGNFTKLLTKNGRVYAIDYNNFYLEELRKTLGDSAKVGFGDIESGRLDFKGVKFNTIICMNVLEHIDRDEKALENMYSLLQKNGRLILLVPAFSFAYGLIDKNLGHFRRYTAGEVSKKLKNAGFKSTEVRYLNSLALLGWFVNAKILKRKIIPRFQLTIFNLIARPVLLLEKKIKFPFGLSVLAIGRK
jgi:2-polyprenyl-3-methyl-5-hydroxy-6-metoxy-1,4-benzoquinol methylase